MVTKRITSAPESNDALEGDVLAQEDQHVLVLDGEEFICKPDVKLGFLIRSAKNGLEGLQDIITYCYAGDPNEVYDVTDNMDLEDIGTAVAELVESYTKDRTAQRSSSRGGSERTGRR